MKRGIPVNRAVSGVVALAAALFFSACDMSVVNPGPVQDEFLNDPGAHSALVAGASFTLSHALSLMAFGGADAAKEYTQGGRIHPIKLPVVPGQLTLDDLGSATFWTRPQRARWIADDAVRRLRDVAGDIFDSYQTAGRALLYAGYANRMLGENMCEAVIDSGAAEPGSVYFERAQARFSEAIEVAGRAGDVEAQMAARAGRASARVQLGDWDGAASDAAQVPDDFVYQALYTAAEEDQFNFIYFVNANQPFRAHSVVDVYYEDYYGDTGDPRVSWDVDPNQPTAEFVWVPWLFQTKFTSRDDNINLSSGREMRLIEAEALLRQGEWQGAMAGINALRATVISDHTGAPIPAWQASNEEEAWTHLKRERGIELWLEGRRMADLRRWIAEGTPGAMEDVTDRIRLCFPIFDVERQTNPNIPLDHQDPVNPIYTGAGS